MVAKRPLLSIEDLQVFYGPAHVLHGATLEVPAGQVTVVAGKNGVGKTTLINSIMGLVPAASGSIRFRDQELIRLAPSRRRALGIALVPQGRRLFRSLTVEEHLTLTPATSDTVFTREWIYETFPCLAERRRSVAHTLSGGEQSMLAISRALSTNPRLLLMDEPTEGLAPLLVETVSQVVSQLREMGLTVMLVEQNLMFALQAADCIAIMQRGRIENVASAEEISDVAALSNRILAGAEEIDPASTTATSPSLED